MNNGNFYIEMGDWEKEAYTVDHMILGPLALPVVCLNLISLSLPPNGEEGDGNAPGHLGGFHSTIHLI